MKLFFSEFRADYSKYHFPYQVWLLKEDKDSAEKIYESGFLPIRSLPNVYYLSRNVRVNLGNFDLSSENRRILRKSENLSSDLIPLSDFDYNAEVQKLCLDYCRDRFVKGTFSAKDIKTIFKGSVFNYVFVFKDNQTQKSAGFAVCFISSGFLQYAHAFYNLNYLAENIGARMILEAVVWAKKSQKKYAYLGTCYEEKALYKTEYTGTEFFNGFKWSDNLEELKELVRVRDRDREYLLRDEKFLERFYQKNLESILNNFGVRVNL